MFEEKSRVYVGSLNMKVSKKDIINMFSVYGTILEISLKNKYCFIQFSNQTEANKSLKENG